jgi:uncharacterized membrane protein YtjA (UPF0391 family)
VAASPIAKVVPYGVGVGTSVASRPAGEYLEARVLSWALTFLILSLVAALFGFGGIAASAAGIARFLFFLFLVLFVLSLSLRRQPSHL